jgi:hypothetical protein
MSVLVEMINVIVRIETLERKYPGGADAYARDCNRRTFCADDYLTRVGFMNPQDVQRFIDRLVGLGFVFHDGEKFVDVAVVIKRSGSPRPTTGLSIAGSRKVSQAAGSRGRRTIGPRTQRAALPRAWQPQTCDSWRRERERLRVPRHQGNGSVLRHRQTAKLSYTARAADDSIPLKGTTH